MCSIYRAESVFVYVCVYTSVCVRVASVPVCMCVYVRACVEGEWEGEMFEYRDGWMKLLND